MPTREDRGRVTRGERVAQVQELLDEGLHPLEVALRLKLSHSHVRDLINDPSGALGRERRLRYQGECRLCGAATDGSNGRAKAPEVCARCYPTFRGKKWTRESVVDAIRRYALAHGSPPKSTDWISSSPEYGYPASSSIFAPGGPFDSWADAIEAAGFRRPRVGDKPHHRPRIMNGELPPMPPTATRIYLVFRVDSEEALPELVGRVEAPSGDSAIGLVAETPEGEWATVPESALQYSRFVTRPSLERVRKREAPEDAST